MASKLTKYDLENVTDYIGFESFCHDLMSREKYKNIEPLGGSKDKGRDALHINKKTREVTIFTYSVREDWDKKLKEDLEKLYKHKHPCNKVVFITTGKVSATNKDNLKKAVLEKYSWLLDIYDLERIATLIDNHYYDLKKLHPGIFTFSSSLQLPEPNQNSKTFDRKIYAGYLLKAYEEWIEKYTPLLAEHRSIETFVVISEASSAAQQGIPVTKIPESSPIAIVLGESGAGKTTALWKIIVENSKNLVEDKPAKLPILINLRGWSPNSICRNLAQKGFNLVDASESSVEAELQDGNCLILVDGLNELPPNNSIRTEAYKDIQQFLITYPRNSFVICCRTSDYELRALDFEQLKPILPKPKVFEIMRLDRAQINDYIVRYFRNYPTDASLLISELKIKDDTVWRNSTSLLHLARIPLYLQLIILEFQSNKKLPKNRAQLLSSFVQNIIRRENARHTASLNKYAKEKLLGALAYRAFNEGYLLRLPEQRAQSIVENEIQNLKQHSIIQEDLTLGTVWQEILSNNFLHVAGWQWIEWLHQLILDYFLACKILDIRTNGTQEELIELNGLIQKQTWEQPCVIAMGLFDALNGGRFLLDLTKANQRTAQLAFENQNDFECKEIAKVIVAESANNIDNINLSQVAVSLPYYPVVQNFYICFKPNADPTRIKIAEAISSMVIKYYPLTICKETINKAHYYEELLRIKIFDQNRIETAVKRGLELLTSWSKNKNDFVRFFSAKGLWESNRGLATETFQNLMKKSKDNLIKVKVKELMDQWGIT